MNITEFVSSAASKLSIEKDKVKEVISLFLESICSSIKEDGEFRMPSVGTLKVKKRAERKGYNIVDKKPITIPEHNTVVFNVDKNLKSSLNK